MGPRAICRLAALLLALVIALPGTSRAQAAEDPTEEARAPFSAVAQLESDGRPFRVEVHATQDVLRLDLLHEGSDASMLLNRKEQEFWMLVPARRLALRFDESWLADDVIGAVASEDLCARTEDLQCRRVGEERIDGRLATRWEVTDASGAPIGTYWFDERLRFPLRMEQAGFHMRLENVQEAPQPEDLFEIPDDYTRLRVPALPGEPEPLLAPEPRTTL